MFLVKVAIYAIKSELEAGWALAFTSLNCIWCKLTILEVGLQASLKLYLINWHPSFELYLVYAVVATLEAAWYPSLELYLALQAIMGGVEPML